MTYFNISEVKRVKISSIIMAVKKISKKNTESFSLGSITLTLLDLAQMAAILDWFPLQSSLTFRDLHCIFLGSLLYLHSPRFYSLPSQGFMTGLSLNIGRESKVPSEYG